MIGYIIVLIIVAVITCCYLAKVIRQKKVDLDSLSKDNLIEYINNIKYVKLDLTNLRKLTHNMELESNKLVTMEVEYYEKLKNTLPKYVKKETDGKKSRGKKKYGYNIPPTFSAETFIESTNIIPSSDNINLDFLDDCKPVIKFKNTSITKKEFNESFSDNLTTNKDMIGLSKFILSNMNDYHKLRLIKSYNDIYFNIEDVNYASFGKGTLIYKKAKKGPTDVIGSYRMIIVAPIVINHFHRILTMRISDFMMKNNFLDTLVQKGGIIGQKSPILQHVFKVKSALRHANRNNNKLGVMFLDITNAYGSLNRDALIRILENYGISKTFTNYLRRYYDTFQYHVKTKNWAAKNIKMNTGLLQGDPMSALLFNTALNSVFTHLNKKYMDTHAYPIVSDDNMMLLAFIDDICLMCKDKNSLIAVYTELKELLGRLGFKLHPKKSGTMLINHDEDEMDTIDEIPNVDVYKYLGEYITPDGTSQLSYNKTKSLLYARLLSINKRDLTNEDRVSILRRQIVPWLKRKLSVMYDLSKSEKKKIINIIKYCTKDWSIPDITIFYPLDELLEGIDDEIIKKCIEEDVNGLDELRDEDGEVDEDFDKYVVKSHEPIDFDYKDIDNDDDIFED